MAYGATYMAIFTHPGYPQGGLIMPYRRPTNLPVLAMPRPMANLPYLSKLWHLRMGPQDCRHHDLCLGPVPGPAIGRSSSILYPFLGLLRVAFAPCLLAGRGVPLRRAVVH